MKHKASYCVRNWPEYNKSLVKRGSITLWISKKALSDWRYQGKRAPGGVKAYSDVAIQACLLVKEVYQLSYRQCEGFIRSLVRFLPIDRVPHYTTLCRRTDRALFDLLKQRPKQAGMHVLIDSTGLKIYGEGEWFRKKHGVTRYSLWVKLHAAVDHDSQTILSVERSDAHGYDSKYLPALLENKSLDIRCIYGDGAYDKRLCYQTSERLGAQLITPVQHRACKQQANRNHPNESALLDRDRQIDFIRSFDDEELARALWKKVSRYHKRSLVETAMFRLKHYFGNRLNCRRASHQCAQMQARAYALNKMTELGMPVSEKIS